jgi:zinc and cadmium transporter
LSIGTKINGFASVMLPVTAGGFIYIAGSDLLPELHRESDPTKSVIQMIAMAAGVALMVTLAILE